MIGANIDKKHIREKRDAKVKPKFLPKEKYGCNEVPPNLSLLRKGPRAHDFSKEGKDRQKFIYENMSKFPSDRVFIDYTKRRNTLILPEDKSRLLTFESRFENGNLKKAI